jgi:hypothetical protein
MERYFGGPTSRWRVPERYSLSYGNSIFGIESQTGAFDIMNLSGSEHPGLGSAAGFSLKSLMRTDFVAK